MGYKNTKKYGEEIYSRRQTFRAKVHKSNIRVKRWHSNYEILKKKNIERHNFWLNYLPIKSNQACKVEERTFGTPCEVASALLSSLLCAHDQFVSNFFLHH